MAIDWMLVQDSVIKKKKIIGAVGFIGDKISVIASFYEDRDLNEDGKVSFGEWVQSKIMFSMQGRAVAHVAAQAYADPDILMRDPTLYNWRGKLLTKFASGLINEGIYKVYFQDGISSLTGSIAKSLTSSTIKSFFIKKGMEKAIEDLYMRGTKSRK